MKSFDSVAQLLTRKFGTPSGVIHHEFAWPSENLMVHRKGRPHRESCVPRGRLNVDPLKGRAIENLSVREAIECNSARQTQRLLLRFLRQCAPMSRKNFF